MDVGFVIFSFHLLIIGFIKDGDANTCGCKSLRPCYEAMVRDLKHGDEVFCVEQAAIGGSTVEIYLQALNKYCKEFVQVKEASVTSEGRTLYEVTVEETEKNQGSKPMVLIDAGQEAGVDSVGFALYFIQQLIACEDYMEMTAKVRWIILPSTNPDGMEYGKMDPDWRKNMVTFADKPGIGVDISRNFDFKFESCTTNKEVFSPSYPGTTPNSEAETKLISDVIEKYSDQLAAYVSIRRDGHSILYPYAHEDKDEEHESMTTADTIASRVNARTGSIRVFTNTSIFKENGEKRCGHSVDFAFSKGIKIALELRTFHRAELDITMKFQNIPRGYEATLRNGYFIALRELYNIITTKANEGGGKRM